MKQEQVFSAARRSFLRGDVTGESDALRPPWGGEPSVFYDRCTRCDACVTACPEKIIIRSSSGYPVLNFKAGGCTFCGECVAHCEPQALQKIIDIAPWNLRANIGDKCLAKQHVVCFTCGERCEVGAIRFKPTLGGISQPELNDTLCTGCGFCVADCPTQAIDIKGIDKA